jgi:hypothetical protein
MSLSSNDPKIRALAQQLGLDTRGNCVKRLRDYAVAKVHGLVEALPVDSTETLLHLVAGIVSVKVLFIHSDEEARRFGEVYREEWPELAGQLRREFLQSDTLGLVLTHPAPKHGAHRNVAFIDARGDRHVRAYFTAWHEISHLLLEPDQLALAGFRRVDLSHARLKDPVEALVDQVAGELAFYDPFVRPAFESEVECVGTLTLDGVSRIAAAVAPEASFSSAAFALVRMAREPMAFLVADMRLKPTEARRLNSGQLTFLDARRPQEKLRVISVYPNDRATDAGFKIFQHFRVPPESVISRVYHEGLKGSGWAEENQATWESGGRYLGLLPLRVEARRFGSVVYALMSCRAA